MTKGSRETKERKQGRKGHRKETGNNTEIMNEA
jgi:hypothetical protein